MRYAVVLRTGLITLMKTKLITAENIKRGNIIDSEKTMCHVLRVRADGPVAVEFLLMPFGCAEQGVTRYAYLWNKCVVIRYVTSEVSK